MAEGIDSENIRRARKKKFRENLEFLINNIPFYGNLRLMKRVEKLRQENIQLKTDYAIDSIGAGMITSDMDLKTTQEAIIKDMKERMGVDSIRYFDIDYADAPVVKSVFGIDGDTGIFEIKNYPSKIEKLTGRIVPWVVLEKSTFHLDLKDHLLPRLYQLEIKENGEINRMNVPVNDYMMQKIIRNAAESKVWEKVEMPIMEKTESGMRVSAVVVADNAASGFYRIADSRILTMSRGAQIASVQLRNARLYEENLIASIYDKLTGVYNRRKFDEEIKKETIRSLRYNHSFSLAFMDLDHFKQINDLSGHLVGDSILKEFAPLIKGFTRKDIDIIARYGGDEFAIIFPETRYQDALKSVENLRKMVANYNFSSDKRITISAGIAELTGNKGGNEEKLIEKIISNSDSSLYKAKNSGRNRVCAYETE